MAVLIECPKCRMKQKATNKRCTKCNASIENAKKSGKAKYWVHFRVNGKQKVEPVMNPENEKEPGTYEHAKALDGKRKGMKAERKQWDVLPEAKMTFNALGEWFLDLEEVKDLASYDTLKIYLNKFNSDFGERIVSTILPSELRNHQIKRKKEGKADATVDQEIGAAKNMINKAFDDRKVGSETYSTFKKIKKLLKKDKTTGQMKNARKKILSQGEFIKLMEAAPKHTKQILVAAFYTGMRRSEILKLTWDKVNLKERVIRLKAEDTKDGDPREIPILDELYAVLSTISPRPIHNLDKKLVFPYRRNTQKGKTEDDPLTDIRGGLRKACETAGITYGRFAEDGFIFHDLRHAFNTYMRKAGVAESVIMNITGHSTRAMFDLYNTIDREDRTKAAGQLQGFFARNKNGENSG